MSFYIFSKQHSYDGVAGFWKPNRNGYTNSIFEAGMYSREEAKEIVQEARGEEVAIHSWCFPALYFSVENKLRLHPNCIYTLRKIEEFLSSISERKDFYIQYEK